MPSRVYAFLPLGAWEPGKRIIRIGHTSSDKPLKRLFQGLNEPSIMLLEEVVEDGAKAFDDLQQILRGNLPYGEGKRFRSYADFADPMYSLNWKETNFTVAELRTKFAEVALYFRRPVVGEAGEEDALGRSPAVERLQEQQPPGEQVVMRVMSSAQAAAILCGVPGSIEAVLDE